MNARELQHALSAPFEPDQIQWRVGSTTRDGKRGMALAYIDARAVMNRLDSVMGIDGWQDEYQVHGTRTLCRLGVRIGLEWVWKTDGAGDSQVEGEKGSISDAFKRAAVKWGIGRYIYDIDSPWVELDENKKMKTTPKLPAWALPKPLPATGQQQPMNGTGAVHHPGQPPTEAQKTEYRTLVLWAHEMEKITADQRTELLAWLDSPTATSGEAQRRIERWKQAKAAQAA